MTAPVGVAPRPLAVAGITFDFGNTLVPVRRPDTRRMVVVAAEAMAERSRITDAAAFLEAWSEEAARQFRQEVPEFREVDLGERLARVLARLRGMAPPRGDDRWDDAAARRLVDPAEIAEGLEAYTVAFVAGMPPIEGVGAVLERLAARGFVLGILSNWPLATILDRYVAAQGWDAYLRAIVVSQRVGTIKPHPAIFAAASEAMGLPPAALLHVGDDWEADVAGGRAAGWHVAYLRDRQGDSPLPSSAPGGEVQADLVVDGLEEVEAAVVLRTP